MKYEEALKLVEECGLNISAQKHDECMAVIKQALKKQIPKRLKNIRFSKDYVLAEHNIKEGKCPVCGETVTANYFGEYCGCCGQKVTEE